MSLIIMREMILLLPQAEGKANAKNYFQFKYYKNKGKHKFQKIIELAKELEKKFENNYLDIEFGYKGKLYLFQS